MEEKVKKISKLLKEKATEKENDRKKKRTVSHQFRSQILK